METAIIVAIVSAVATLVSAWIITSRQTKKKTETVLDVYALLGKDLFEVRRYGEIILSLLNNDPGPNFEEEIVLAGNGFREACDNLQKMVGSNRLLISKKMYKKVADLISASADLIESLRRGMVRAAPPDQIAQELTERYNAYKDCLIETERVLTKEGRAI